MGDDDYYPEGIDKAEFDAMVAEEMARLEREARMAAQQPMYDDTADLEPYSYGQKQSYAPQPVARAPVNNPPRPPIQQSPRDAKRAQQAEYARLLQQDQDIKSRGPSRENSAARRPAVIEEERRRKEAMNLQLNVPKPVLDIFGNAAKLSGRSPSKNVISDEHKEKIDRQREYARQLESDRNYRDKQHSGRSQRGGDPRQRVVSPRHRKPDDDTAGIEIYTSKGGHRPGSNDHRSKAEKQQEYARQLEHDRYQRDLVVAERGVDVTPRQRLSRGRNRPSEDEGYAGGFMIGGASDNVVDKNSKRRQQEEYAAQLKNQSATPPEAAAPRNDKVRLYNAEHMSDGNNLTSIQLGGYDINTSQRISNKRAQQREYSEELTEASHRAPIPSVAEERRNRLAAENHESRNSLAIGGDISTAEQRHLKISEQRKYNRELQEAANAEAISGPPRKSFLRREQDNEHPLGMGRAGGGIFGNQESTAVARSNKKHAQDDYARQLLEDQRGVREPNIPVGRGYEAPGVGSPGQSYGGYRTSSRDRQSNAILSGRDKGYVGLDKGKYSGPGGDVSYDNAAIQQTDYYQADENINQFRPVAVSDRVRDYKDRQAAYAKLLQADATQRDSMRADNGIEESGSAQARKRATSTGRLRPGRSEVDYYQNQGTGLMIGGMDINTANYKLNKKLQQEKYAQDIANAKAAAPIPESYRSIHRDQTEYMGNGLPGGKQIPFREQSGAAYHNNMDFSAARDAGSRQKDFQLRGSSTGGGRSQIHF